MVEVTLAFFDLIRGLAGLCCLASPCIMVVVVVSLCITPELWLLLLSGILTGVLGAALYVMDTAERWWASMWRSNE